MIKIAYAPIYKYQLPVGHRFPMIKYELIPEQLKYEGLINDVNIFVPNKLTREEILSTHAVDYLDRLENLQLNKKEIRKIGFPLRSELIERGKYIAMGTLQCAVHALENGISLNVAGGTHHSFKDRGEGFCIFNDIAIASNLLLKKEILKKILIVDLDVHQGNGTAKIFEKNKNVFTFSMHGKKNYPLKKERSDLDIGLPDFTLDEIYLKTLQYNLIKTIHKFKPEFIFYLSGVDVLQSDKLGRLSLSLQGCEERDYIVLSTCKKHQIPVAVCMGGGYSVKISTIVDAHVNTFKVAIDIFE